MSDYKESYDGTVYMYVVELAPKEKEEKISDVNVEINVIVQDIVSLLALW